MKTPFDTLEQERVTVDMSARAQFEAILELVKSSPYTVKKFSQEADSYIDTTYVNVVLPGNVSATLMLMQPVKK